jgi:hypothetical protein
MGKPTKNATSKHILPVVPVVAHSRNGNHGREKQRQDDDAEFGNVAASIERPDLAGQVPGQETQPTERP